MQAQPHLIDPYARHGFNLGLRIYGMSSTMPGSAHDLKIVRRRMGLGKWERTMKDPDTSNDKRITIKGDKGFQGLEKSYPGAKIEIPDKKPKGRELDSQQKKKNRALSRRLIVVEHAIGRIKRFARMREYENTFAEYGENVKGSETNGLIRVY